MDKGTKIRTFFAALAALVGAYYTYRGLLEDLLTQLGLGQIAIVIALVAVVAMIISEAGAAYFNNDYTESASVGTTITRMLKLDPTLAVTIGDGDEDDADEEEEEDEEGDDIIDPYEGDESGEME